MNRIWNFNNLQWLIRHKTKRNKTKSYIFNNIYINRIWF